MRAGRQDLRQRFAGRSAERDFSAGQSDLEAEWGRPISVADVLVAVVAAWMEWGRAEEGGLADPTQEVLLTGASMLATEAFMSNASKDAAKTIMIAMLDRAWLEVAAQNSRQPGEPVS